MRKWVGSCILVAKLCEGSLAAACQSQVFCLKAMSWSALSPRLADKDIAMFAFGGGACRAHLHRRKEEAIEPKQEAW